MVKKILKIFKSLGIKIGKKSKIKFVKDRPGHDFRYALNSRKMRNKLKWRSTIKIDKGLSETIMWYQKNKRIFKNRSNLIYEKRLGLKKWLKKELF